MTPDGDEIGKVAKQFSGVARDLITDADNFSVSFPLDLDVKIKAVLFGAVFLIDMMFFEDTNDGSEQIGINNWKNKLKNEFETTWLSDWDQSFSSKKKTV